MKMTATRKLGILTGTLLVIAVLMVALAAVTVESSALSGLEAKGYVSSSSGAYLRKGAGTSYGKLATLPSGSPVIIHSEFFTNKKKNKATYRWYYVTTGAGVGYMRSDTVAVSQYGYAKGTTKKKIVYRAGAGTKMKKKGSIKKKKTFTILLEARAKGSTKRWYKIQRSGKIYYVSSSNTKISDISSGAADLSFSNPAKEVTQSAASLAVVNGACSWAIQIANDNTFHYGLKPNSQHNGCYFCGTQVSLSDPLNINNLTHKGLSKTGVEDYQHTYCCNPFVHAAFAHGGNEKTMLSICKSFTSYDYKANRGYDVSPLFAKLGKPAMDDLKKGDVICWSNHVALYLGNRQIAEAAGGDDNVPYSDKWNNSIRVCTLSDSRYASAERTYRYIGAGM